MLIVVLPFLGYLIWSYKQLCQDENPPDICFESLPNVYSWVQAKYWNVGPLRYFTMRNIIFILIGLPAIGFSIMFLRIPRNDTWGLHLSFWVLLTVTVLFTNIQSSTRFLCSHPLFYLNAAQVLFDKSATDPLKALFNCWRYGMCFCGMVLFAVGFPWT